MNRAVIIADLVTCYRKGKDKYPNMVIDYAKLVGVVESGGYNVLRKIGVGNKPSFAFVSFLKRQGFETYLECTNMIMALKAAEVIALNGADTLIFVSEDLEIVPILKYARMMGKKTYVVCAEKTQEFERCSDLIFINEDILMPRKIEEANGA